MSGICGILRLDGGPPEGLEAMATQLERRGPEGTHLWRDGSVALGHTLLATTPEALHEKLPLTDPATGCTITADARLDNREELLAALGLSGPRIVGDGELLLRAYIAWGEAALSRLLGDFAFAIWDPRVKRRFAARDQMGMRQLAYAHVPGRVFAFATEPRAVLEAEGVPRGIDEGRIAHFLEGYLEMIDPASTFFEGVLRLPPAHCLSASPGGLVLRRYWSLEPESELRLDGDEAYAREFLAIFTEAVRCRLRGAGPVGSMLSGGMDSSAIVAVAARLLAQEGRGPLPTFSAVGPDPATCAETRAAHAALTLPGLDPRLVNWAEPDTWREDLSRDLDEIAEPFDGHMNLPRAVYRLARQSGIKVVLDGVGGDVVLSTPDRIPWLLRRGRWLAAWREARGEQDFWELGSPWQAMRPALSRAFVPASVRRWRWLATTQRRDRQSWPASLPGLAERSGLAGHRLTHARTYMAGFRSLMAERAADIASVSLIAGRERYDRVAAGYAIEPRDPFLDLRVVRFAKRLPADQLQSGGWPKIMLRRALAGLLPAEVVWRKGRQHLGYVYTQELFKAPGLAQEHERLSSVGTGTATGVPARRDRGLDGFPATHIKPLDQIYLRTWLRGTGKIDCELEALYVAWKRGRGDQQDGSDQGSC